MVLTGFKKIPFPHLGSKTWKGEGSGKLLKLGLTLVQEEPKTTSWFAIKMDESTYGIFDAFQHESGRDVHLSGKVAEALVLLKKVQMLFLFRLKK